MINIMNVYIYLNFLSECRCADDSFWLIVGVFFNTFILHGPMNGEFILNFTPSFNLSFF